MSGMGFNLSQGARLGQNLKLSPRMLTTMSVLESDLRAELASIDGAIWEESVADSFRQARA